MKARDPDPKHIPKSIEAEISVLGALVIDPEAVPRVLETLEADDFYQKRHRVLFRGVVRLFENGTEVDVVTLSEDLKDRGKMEDAGGHGYLAEILDAVPTAANVEYHARIVANKAMLRRLYRACELGMRDVLEATELEATEVVDRAESRILSVASRHHGGGWSLIDDLLWPAFEEIERLQQSDDGVIGIPTGFYDIDSMTGGMRDGDLLLLAARPAMGKTSLALNIAVSAAKNEDRSVAVFSVEMAEGRLTQRAICSEARVSMERVRNENLEKQEFQRLASAAGHIEGSSLWIEESPGLTPTAMRAKARRLDSESGLDLIVIDYLQLMAPDGSHQSRVQEVTEISRNLKALARELDVPVLALSQLSRGPEKRSDKRPQLSDLRDSGSLEQDADAVFFLFRPEYYFGPRDKDGNDLRGHAEFIIAKQRNGPTGTVDLHFNKEYTRFDSVDHHTDEPFR